MTAAAAATAVDAEGWRRLSPRMLLVHPVRELPKVLPLVLPAVVLHGGHHNSWAWAVTALAIGAGLLRWWTTRYRVGADLVELRHGLLIRRHITVPADRVRTVDLHAGAAHRVLGLAAVTVGTGRAAQRRGEGLRLDALARPEALELRAALLGDGDGAADGPRQGVELLRFRPGWFRFAPLAAAGFAPVLASALALTGPLAGPLRQTPIGALVDALLHARALGPLPVRLPLVLLLAATAINLLTFAERAGAFALRQLPNGALEIGHGLLNRRTTTLEKRRVYGVELTESLPMRLFGGARLTAVATASARERSGPALAPAVPRRAALAVAARVLGGDAALSGPLTGHGPRARTRRLTRALGGWAGAAAVLGAAVAAGRLPLWAPAVWVAALPLAGAVALDRHCSLGHAVADGRLVIRSGSLLRRRTVLAGEGVIGWNLRRTRGGRRAGLVTLTATTAAGRKGYRLPDLPEELLPGLAEEVLPGLLAPFLVRE
ncbi:PH domain-containing protein [Streptomyces sp. TLI_171]|uniref:PH domain-containing protein n=1 Tax=Streptomyces sp. TLI_171 TaxID=1938859 RepID=UPI000C1930E2|nr:PH domain-containing protein [Streptomyces sp. TLI_171]RKE21277.1 putative membrane protein [Streptomyces sp. TLI_171]